MATFEQYCNRFEFVQLERRDGILCMTMHTGGGSLQWGPACQAELALVFDQVANDAENRVVILSGTGQDFIGPRQSLAGTAFARGANTSPLRLDALHRNARKLMLACLDIGVPMIGVVNGPAKRHADLALMCDIVIASHDASFEDTAHFQLGGLVPGDGINVVLQALLGLNRARYFMLAGQVLTAPEAYKLGLVAELHARADLPARAWALAERLASKPDMLLRAARSVLVWPLRAAMRRDLPHSLAQEAIAMLDGAGK